MTTLTFPAPHRHWHGGWGLFDGLRTRWAEQRRLEHHARLEDELRGLWREACAGVGLCQYIAVAAGLTVRTPRFGAARILRGRTTFTTELLPGGEPEDIAKHALRLAHSLGFHGMRVDPIGGRWVRIVLLDSDPLRVLNLPRFVVAMLDRRTADAPGPVFPDTLGGWRDPSNTRAAFRHARGSDGFAWVTSHVFRKTCATVLDAAGQTPRAVADQLGHAHISTTQDHYFGRRLANPAAATALDVWHDQEDSHG